MLKSLRSAVRRWLGVPESSPAHAVPARLAPSADGMARFATGVSAGAASTWAFLVKDLRAAPRGTDTATKFSPPKLPPGVVPANAASFAPLPGEQPFMALDSAEMAPTYAWAGQLGIGIGFQGYTYLAQLTQLAEYRSPAETMAKEMTRRWIEWRYEDTGEGGADKLKQMEQAFKDFKVQELFRRAAEQDCFFGRSQIYVMIRNETDDLARQLPLIVDEKHIGVGDLKGLNVIEPYWTTPFSYNANDPSAPDFYKPTSWFIVGRKTHSSRLLSFVSREVPDLLKPAYNFGGISLTQLLEPYVNQWLRTRNSVSDLIHNFSILALKTDMASSLNDVSAGTGLMNRMKAFIGSRDNQGMMLLDKDAEELMQIAVPLSGLDALQAQSQEHMAGPSHIPLVKLFGITPTGLNASSEGEIKVFYDFVRSVQEQLFRPQLDRLSKIMQLHLFGTVDDAITFDFVTLDEPTAKEESEIRKASGDQDCAYVDRGILSPEEVRAKLARDPDSGYDDIDVTAVPEHPDVASDPDGEAGGPGPGGENQEDEPDTKA